MMAIAGMAAIAATPTVSNVTAKQRFPWNGLVDIFCTVSGIDGTTNGLKFVVAAVMPDSSDVNIAATASPIEWKLKLDGNTLAGTKKTLVADKKSSTGVSEGVVNVSWVKQR